MKDKFRENFLIVLPAALITVVLFFVTTMHGDFELTEELTYSIWRVVPYILVLVGALIGINVFVVLLGGTVVSLIVGLATGSLTPATMFSAVGEGVTGMYDITVISIVVACIVSLVREAGGIHFILNLIRRRIRRKPGERKRALRGWRSWWTCVPPTIRWPLLCQAPSPKRSARSLTCLPADPPPFWISLPRWGRG